ncbi:S8 family serine peptidase [Candidatus Acetothermia bacterium]|nr:S8 family serine peptidase [Candidatus Acetothermia bacterium]
MNAPTRACLKLLTLAFIFVGVSALTVLAQPLAPTAFDTPESTKLQRQLSVLAGADRSHLDLESMLVPGTEPAELERHMVRAVFEVKSANGLAKIRRAIEAAGGSYETGHDNVMQALVPIASVENLSKLDEIDYTRLPQTPVFFVQSEGLSSMGVDAWSKAGVDGKGVKVAILDAGFKGYKDLLGTELPPAERVITKSFRRDGDIEADQEHGAAVAEIVYDIAPGATFYLVNINTDVEFFNAVDYLIAEKVNVVNTSFGFQTGCPQENRGLIEPALEKARKAGIFWAASAGNAGRGHWVGDWNDPDKNNLLNFTDSDESQSLRVQQDDVLILVLSWDDPCGTSQNDYDISVRDGDGKELARSGRVERGWPLKSVAYRATFNGTVHVFIKRNKGTAINIIDLWSRDDLEYRVPAGSVSVSEPSISANVMTAGAIDFSNDRLRSYSSRGPTKSGRIKPDISGPDGVSTVTFGPESSRDGGFFGTSASSPHLAGAGVLVKAQNPDLNPAQIQGFLENRAVDLGEPGKDGAFGAGRLSLGDPNEKPKPNAAPKADAGPDQNAKAGDTVQLDASKSSDPDGDKLRYVWSFVKRPANGYVRLSDPASPKPTFVPDVAGEYVLELTVEDGKGDSSRATVKVTATGSINRAPQANAGTDQTVKAGDTVTLDASKSSDPDGDSLKFSWVFVSRPNGSQAKIADPNAAKTNFVADLAGTYVVELTVDDSKGGTSKAQVKVTAQADQQPTTGQVLVLAFNKLEFVDPSAWDRALKNGCVVYTNKSNGPAKIRVTTVDSQVLEFDIAAGKEVVVCGEAVHIDTRP